jgi:hypothetical protein
LTIILCGALVVRLYSWVKYWLFWIVVVLYVIILLMVKGSLSNFKIGNA